MPAQRTKAEDLVRSLAEKLFVLCSHGPIVGDDGSRYPLVHPLSLGDFSIAFPESGDGLEDASPRFRVDLPNGFAALVEIETSQILEGDPGNWEMSLRSFVRANRRSLAEAWRATRDPGAA